MDNSWIPPPEDVIKINVNGVFVEAPLENGNQNDIGLVARDHEGSFLWGVMGPLCGMNGFQAQLWAIHLAMHIAFKKQINFVEIETDNVPAFDILLDPDEDIVDEEGLEQVIQQINVLFFNFNKSRSDGSRFRNCRIREVFTSRNGAPLYLA